MVWPTAPIPTANLDAGTDSPAAARADLLLQAQQVNQMQAHGAVFADGLAAGIYSASVTNPSNLTASVPFSSMYIHLGTFVQVHVGVEVNVIAAGGASFNLSIPVASNFSAAGNAVGSGAATGTTPTPARVIATGSTQTVSVYFKAVAAGAHTLTLSFMYRVL
jgi:hypothetical protein